MPGLFLVSVDCQSGDQWIRLHMQVIYPNNIFLLIAWILIQYKVISNLKMFCPPLRQYLIKLNTQFWFIHLIFIIFSFISSNVCVFNCVCLIDVCIWFVFRRSRVGTAKSYRASDSSPSYVYVWMHWRLSLLTFKRFDRVGDGLYLNYWSRFHCYELKSQKFEPNISNVLRGARKILFLEDDDCSIFRKVMNTNQLGH